MKKHVKDKPQNKSTQTTLPSTTTNGSCTLKPQHEPLNQREWMPKQDNVFHRLADCVQNPCVLIAARMRQHDAACLAQKLCFDIC